MNNQFSKYFPKKQQPYNDPLDINNALSSYTKVKPIVSDNNGVKQNYLEDYSQVQNSINKLFESKYGLGNFDINKGWYNQTTKPLSTWSDENEYNALGEYQKLGTDFGNANLGINAYNTLQQNQAQNQGINSIFKEQAEKYVPSQLQMQGLGKVGSSEIPIGSIERSYLNRYNDVNQDFNNQVNTDWANYQEALKGSQLELEQEKYTDTLKQQDLYYTNFNNNLASIETKGGFLLMLEEARKVLSNDQYNALYQNALKVAKELGYDLTIDETQVIPSYATFDPNDSIFSDRFQPIIDETKLAPTTQPKTTKKDEEEKTTPKTYRNKQGGLVRQLKDYTKN